MNASPRATIQAFVILILFFCCFANGTSATGEEETMKTILLDDFRSLDGWTFANGAEFPGAQGKLFLGDEGLAVVRYDFTAGGAYVSATYDGQIPPATELLRLRLKTAAGTKILFRIQDADGAWFQAPGAASGEGGETILSYNMSGPWDQAWGGKKKSDAPRQPLRSVSLGAAKESAVQSGELALLGLEAVTAASAEELAEAFSADDVRLTAGDWTITGRWDGPWRRKLLVLEASSAAAEENLSAMLTITRPDMLRDVRWSCNFSAEKRTAVYAPALPRGGNSANRYTLEARLETAGSVLTKTIHLSGKDAGDFRFGDPVTSDKIANYPVGTCTHFSYGQSRSFGGWSKTEILIDKIAAAGLKYIRDGVKITKDEAGNLRVSDWDMAWIKYAHGKGIGLISVIDTVAKESKEELIQKSLATIRDLSPYCNVFELGNEPNNFGGWVQTYGGTWNGKEADNSTSPWVKAHLEYTNAAAEAIKKEYPNVILIGLGACAPTNFRYLDLGLSPALDGVVEHPYTFSMQPERVPYGWGLAERDGIKVGDKHYSFEGLVSSYHDKFTATGQERSLWVTEFGFTTFRFDGEKNHTSLYAGFTEEAQAAYLARRILQSLALPIAASCQYDFLDDYGSMPFKDEANFGLVRADHSPKPSYTVMQRLAGMMHDTRHAQDIEINVSNKPLHRSMLKGALVKWDQQDIPASMDVAAYAYRRDDNPDIVTIAVWSAMPYDAEFANRACSLEISGLQTDMTAAVTMELMTGKTFDIPAEPVAEGVKIPFVSLKASPLLLQLRTRR